MTAQPPAPPTRAAVHDALARLVRTELGRELTLPPEANLAEHLDSVQRLTLVVAIEDHFEVCFEPEDDEQVETLEQAVDAVLRLLAAPREATGA